MQYVPRSFGYQHSTFENTIKKKVKAKFIASMIPQIRRNDLKKSEINAPEIRILAVGRQCT
jgi:hypothetical protein